MQKRSYLVDFYEKVFFPTLAANFLDVQFTNVTFLHAGAQAELVAVLFNEVEEHGQLWVVKLVIHRERVPVSKDIKNNKWKRTC